MRKLKTGIEKSETDKVQPWRVWWKGNIIWFARTKKEAEIKLAEQKKLNNGSVSLTIKEKVYATNRSGIY